jgi:hypothetical protein
MTVFEKKTYTSSSLAAEEWQHMCNLFASQKKQRAEIKLVRSK